MRTGPRTCGVCARYAVGAHPSQLARARKCTRARVWVVKCLLSGCLVACVLGFVECVGVRAR
eukprot:5418210-Pleurochrysis_carterae.AAC.1